MVQNALHLALYGSRIREEERTSIPLVRHGILNRCLYGPLVFYSEIIGVAVKCAVAVFAAQDNNAMELTDCTQCSAHSGAAHCQKLCDAADRRKRLVIVAGLLEQAQADAERTMRQLPLKYLTRDQGVVLRHRQQAGVGSLSIAHTPDLLLVLVAAAEINAAGALQLLCCFANGRNGAVGQRGQSIQTDGALAKAVAAAVQGCSHPAGAVRERLIVQEAAWIPEK